MDGQLSAFQDATLYAKPSQRSSTSRITAPTPGSFGRISGTLTDVQLHARHVAEATQKISDQANVIRANSRTLEQVSTQAKDVSLGLSEQAATIEALVKSFLTEIRKL